MPIISLRYAFRQPFRAPADRAFKWCTEFRPADAALFADGRTRATQWLAPDTLLMTDTPARGSGEARITRLVRVFPRQRAWTNTHVTGPFRYSQYWYRVVPDGRARSHLEFTGLKLVRRGNRVGAALVRQRTSAERRADATLWRTKLAPALDRELAA